MSDSWHFPYRSHFLLPLNFPLWKRFVPVLSANGSAYAKWIDRKLSKLPASGLLLKTALRVTEQQWVLSWEYLGEAGETGASLGAKCRTPETWREVRRFRQGHKLFWLQHSAFSEFFGRWWQLHVSRRVFYLVSNLWEAEGRFWTQTFRRTVHSSSCSWFFLKIHCFRQISSINVWFHLFILKRCL